MARRHRFPLGRPDGERGLNHLADKVLKGEQKLTTIMARATAWGVPTVGELSHHATQNAAPAPNAIMRRSSGADRGQKQGASYLLGFQNNPQKIRPIHLRPLITEAHPLKESPTGNQSKINTAPPAFGVGIKGSLRDPEDIKTKIAFELCGVWQFHRIQPASRHRSIAVTVLHRPCRLFPRRRRDRGPDRQAGNRPERSAGHELDGNVA